MRLFVAIEVPAAIVDTIRPVQQKLADTRADVRWVDAGNYHVTVKFLGEVEEQLVELLASRLARAASQAPAFEVEVEGIDRLPAKGPPRVIMSRILSPDQRITRLHRLIDSAVGGMGLPMDTRVLVPHLTLGRVRSNHGVNRLLRLIEKHDLDFFGKFLVERVRLIESVPSAGAQGGSLYRPVARFGEGALRPVEAAAESSREAYA
jgi:2'-5' RNA ligase